MNTLTTLTTLVALAFTALPSKAQEKIAACQPTIVAMRTDFPTIAQERRLQGTVGLVVRLNGDGHVAAARITSSSGHSALDRAALANARRHWRFDVSACAQKDLSIEHQLTVTYRRPPGLTLSGTLNRKAVANTRKLLADNLCHATSSDYDTTIFACRDMKTVGLADAQR